MKNLREILAQMQRRKYLIYQRPYRVNIVGVRSPQTRAGYFDDWLHVFYRERDNNWTHHFWAATLDPGLPYLHLPIHSRGTAIIKEGQYVDAYELGFHRGNSNHPALVQVAPVSVIRDNNRDDFLDLKSGEEMTGLFGINIHRTSYANTGGKKEIRRDSAGCTVLEDPGPYNEEFLPLMRAHRDLHGNRFTYTVLDFRKIRRGTIGRWALRGGLLAAAAAAGMLIYPINLNEDER